MSGDAALGHAHDGHDDHDDHDEQHGLHATLNGYVVGFVLALILTAIPFWIVMTKAIESSGFTIVAILAFAAVQIVVHMVYFLHMTPKAEGGWSMMALAFTIILVVITLSGSLWVMFHLKSNMMPVTAEQMRKAP
jgi:cytochrome o ubiquinol oxidase operon protein cyoD